MKDSSRQIHVWAGSLLRLREDSFSLPLIFGISSTVPDMEWVLSKCLENKWLHWWVNKIIHPFTLIHKVNKEFIYYIHLMVTQDRLTEVWVIWTYIRLQTLQPSLVSSWRTFCPWSLCARGELGAFSTYSISFWAHGHLALRTTRVQESKGHNFFLLQLVFFHSSRLQTPPHPATRAISSTSQRRSSSRSDRPFLWL